jgi:hypothetical protein
MLNHLNPIKDPIKDAEIIDYINKEFR